MVIEAPTFRPLTSLESRSVDFWMELLADAVFDKFKVVKSPKDLHKALIWAASDNGPMLPKVLAALSVERFVAGDRNWGEAVPPEDVLLGPAIDEYLGRALPIVKLRQPYWYKSVVD